MAWTPPSSPIARRRNTVTAALLNTVAHHHVTIAREDYLGVNHWTDPKDHYYYHDHFFNFPQPLQFPR